MKPLGNSHSHTRFSQLFEPVILGNLRLDLFSDVVPVATMRYIQRNVLLSPVNVRLRDETSQGGEKNSGTNIEARRLSPAGVWQYQEVCRTA
ncbi:MAG: hypothetical protein ABI977_15240 [Acidobacteriota bacterium]